MNPIELAGFRDDNFLSTKLTPLPPATEDDDDDDVGVNGWGLRLRLAAGVCEDDEEEEVVAAAALAPRYPVLRDGVFGE